MINSNKYINERLVKNILWLLIIISTIIKIFIGLDVDESYSHSLGARLIQGDSLFDEIWDLYQTSAFPIYLLMEIYKKIIGSFDGVIIFTRTIAGILQIGTGVLFTRVFKARYRNSEYAGILIAAMLPRCIQNFEYGMITTLCTIIACLCLYKVFSNQKSNTTLQKRQVLYLIIGGIFYSECILAYPTMLITVPVVIISMYALSDNRILFIKNILCFFGVCAFLALFFVFIVTRNISISTFLNNVVLIVKDESHDGSNLLLSVIHSITETIRVKDRLIATLAILVCSGIAYFVFTIFFKFKVRFVYYIMAITSVMLVFLNVAGIRSSGCFGLQLRFLLIAIFAFPLYYGHRRDNPSIFWLFGVVGLFHFFGTLCGSNLGMTDNAAYLEIYFVGLILLIGEENQDKRNKVFIYFTMILFIFSLIFSKGYLVRITGISSANILEDREQITSGPAKGIYMYPDECDEYYGHCRDINSVLDKDDVVLFMSSNPIYNLTVPCKFTSLSTIPTVVFSDRWVYYYNAYSDIGPTKVLVDKTYYKTLEDIEDIPLGKYFIETARNVMELNYYWVIEL